MSVFANVEMLLILITKDINIVYEQLQLVERLVLLLSLLSPVVYS